MHSDIFQDHEINSLFIYLETNNYRQKKGLRDCTQKKWEYHTKKNHNFFEFSSKIEGIKIWDNSFNLWSSKYHAHEKGIVALKVNTNGDLISSSQDGVISFWNTDHFILNNTLYIHQN